MHLAEEEARSKKMMDSFFVLVFVGFTIGLILFLTQTGAVMQWVCLVACLIGLIGGIAFWTKRNQARKKELSVQLLKEDQQQAL